MRHLHHTTKTEMVSQLMVAESRSRDVVLAVLLGEREPRLRIELVEPPDAGLAAATRD